MNRENEVVWTSEGLHLNSDTCMDVRAIKGGVLFGQLGAAWSHDLHLAPSAARWLAAQLMHAATESERAS